MKLPPAPGQAALSCELRLLVECCRHGFAAGPGADIRTAAAGADLAVFAALARRHRVEGLAWAALDQSGVRIPGGVADILRTRARQIAQEAMRAAVHSARLDQAFSNAAIPLLFVKGLTVAALAYRDPFLKMAWDIDILVAQEQVGQAAALLEALGHSLVVPASAPGRGSLVAWHDVHKESTWRSSDGQHVELHGRLADHLALIPAIGIGSPRRNVAITPQIVLPTLAADENFAYLCVHGASSAWFRLKWASDLAALLQGAHEGEIGRLHHAARRMGAGRASAQALLLIDHLFGLPLRDALRLELRRDPLNRWLVRAALAQLSDAREPTGRPLGTAMIHLSQLPLGGGLRFALSEIRRQFRVARSNRA